MDLEDLEVQEVQEDLEVQEVQEDLEVQEVQEDLEVQEVQEDLKEFQIRMKDIPISIDEVARFSYRSGFLNKLMLSSSEKMKMMSTSKKSMKKRKNLDDIQPYLS